MSQEPVDPSPFEPFMPASVRDAIAAARRGKGPAAEWLTARGPGWGQVGISFQILRGHPEPVPVEITGWLVGMGMFGDELSVLPDIMERERLFESAPHVLEAFAAGLRAGVPLMKRQWKSIERVAAFVQQIPHALRDVLPLGLVSEQALARGVALKLAQKAKARAVIEKARAIADKKAQKRLDEALAALSNGPAPSESGDLLSRLLDAWRDTFDPALRDPIARLGADAARARGPLRAKSKGELEGAWLALAARKDPSDVDRLLGTPWPGAWKAALARVEALGSFPPDPRIAEALPKIETQYDSFGSRPFHGAAWRVTARMKGAQKGSAPAELLAEASAGSKSVVDLDAAMRSFRDDPSNLQKRLVLADALQTGGDPRGEFIALSIAIAEGNADAAVRKRASELLASHIDAWTGAIPGAERSTRRFERGFLTAVHVKTKADKLAASVSVPEWCTVEELHLEAADHLSYHGDALEALLTRAPSLRALIVHNFGLDDLLPKLKGPFPRIRALGERSWMPGEKIPTMPNVALFGTTTHWTSIEEGLEKAHALGLEALVLVGEHELKSTLAAFERASVPELRLASVRRPFLAMDHEGWLVRLRRGEPAKLVWGSGRYTEGSLGEHVEALASAGHREIVVTLPRTGRAAVEKEAGSLKNVSLDLGGGPFDLWKI